MGDFMGDGSDDVCRDYLRNVCNRGKKCRFTHPPQPVSLFTPNTTNTLEERVKFCRMTCHDFQNDVCSRDECKFMHINNEEQEQFLTTGMMSLPLLEEAIKRSVIPYLPGEIPVCKDYLSGECRRGKTCRFRHLSHCKYRKELEILFGVENSLRIESMSNFQETEIKRVKSAIPGCLPFANCIPPPVSTYPQVYFQVEKCQGHYCDAPPPQVTTKTTNHHFSNNIISASQCLHEEHLSSLQEENTVLKKQMLELKKQVSDLAAANEFLLEQNAGLRLGRKPNGVVALQPPVTVPPTQQIAVAAGIPVSIASVPASQVTLNTVTMSGQPTTQQQLVPVSCTTAQQLMAVSTVTVAAGQTGAPPTTTILAATPVPVSQQQLLPVPVSCPLNTHTAVTPQPQLVPVSLATVSMAPVHISSTAMAAQPLVTVASNGPSCTPLVSYPMMTQQLLQTNLSR